MIETIRRLIDEKCNLSTSAQNIAPDSDLHQAGLTPLMATQLMLALELGEQGLGEIEETLGGCVR
jgi:hypothetical protein